ncbi:MAG: deoxyribodipyrimidine photo-lyase [Pseudomonadaceae bacterium]|nr:deoxyribodipyrimidine photo-lyase [Pseudomonadaceae bacterium]
MSELMWFRNDLRVRDNPALSAAMEAGPTVAVFCVSTHQWRSHDVGDIRLAFLLRSIEALRAELEKLNVPLRVLNTPRFSQVPDALVALCKTLGTQRIYYNDEYPLNERQRDVSTDKRLATIGVTSIRSAGTVILPPGDVLTGDARPYTVYTPFRKRWGEHVHAGAIAALPVPTPQKTLPIESDPLPDDIEGVSSVLMADEWPAGEVIAQELLERFIDERGRLYKDQRDLPGVKGTSTLSHHLSVGSISPHACLRVAAAANDGQLRGNNEGLNTWVNEIVWREFYRHIIAQFDHVSKGASFRRDYDSIKWRQSPDDLAAWQKGETGYPLVDAAMRCLNATGWMHNRLRMVAAMFLTKHLLIDWREGERYFMNQLIDGDFASNNGGWQWSASTGTDAAPYFRIFNPASQGKKFDPKGLFTRRWVPELAGVPDKFLFEAPTREGTSYMEPIVDHKHARQRALDLFKAR